VSLPSEAVHTTEALEAENSRLRSVLRDLAELATIMAAGSRSPTDAAALTYLSRKAADTLEQT
jgi:hypothetical protein